MGRGELAETGTLVATAAAAVRFSPATIDYTITTAAAVFCFQGGHGKKNGGTG